MKILKKSFAVQFHLHILFKKNDMLTIFLQQILSSRLLLLRQKSNLSVRFKFKLITTNHL